MTYLELVQRLASECGASGSVVTVSGATGETLRLARWIASAWDDLQLHRPDWYWMRGSFSFTTTNNDYRYSSTDAGITTRFSNWDLKSTSCYKTAVSDELLLEPVTYEDFRFQYLIGTQPTGRPLNVSVSPALDLLVGPIPDGVYTVRGEYYKTPQTLSLDADTPEMPAQFHMAIVYRAMMLYARYEGAAEVYADGENNYKRFLNLIEMNQLPSFGMEGGMV